MLGRIVEEIARREGPRILAGLIRRTGGHFDLAEEALQDAFERALSLWPVEGIPDRPEAWLTTVARHRVIDLLRRARREVGDETLLEQLAAPETTRSAEDGFPDDRLRLLFTCCHPALAAPAQTALALRALCGLSTREIARAFLEPESTTAQWIARAKRKIALSRIPYEIPPREALPERLAAVLSAIYLVFNEGYAASTGDSILRVDLCVEAIGLGRLLASLLPDETEALGLMLLHDSRRETRIDSLGAIVALEEQDRSRWNADRIAEGLAMLDHALAMRARGPYQIQAAIAALHAKATSASETDWRQIAMLYRALLAMLLTPVVELNAAAAHAMAHGPAAGLAWIERIEARGDLADYHLLPAAKADLLRRSGRSAEAAESYRRAIALVSNPSERAYLETRLLAMNDSLHGA